MIKSFAHKRLHQILTMLEAAKTVEDRGAPGLKLHLLKGARKDIWSVTVQENWRITFRFEAGDAEIVNYEDYH